MERLLNAIIAVMAFSTLLNSIVAAPVLSRNNLIKTARFLNAYGYFDFSKTKDTAGANDPSSPVFVDAIKNLQWFGDIPVTGKLDRRTLELINTTRCGVKDHRPPSARGQHSIGEFNLHHSQWNKMDLTFRIINFTNDDIARDVQREIFRRSLRMWEAASGLRINEVFSGSADILISFVREKHGDDYPFDRKGGTLAHAFYPLNNEGLAGDAHFDDDEEFTTGTTNGVNLDWVAVHEFGHSLGLLHSNVRESIMYPWYKGYVPNVTLTDDDIQGIQERYGKPSSKPTPTTATTTKPPTTTSQTTTITTPTQAWRTTTTLPPTTSNPATTVLLPSTSSPAEHPACLPNVRYDAVFVGADRLTYFIRGDHYWTVDRRLKKSEPKKVKARWAEVRTPLDAAYRNPRGTVVFFKGSLFWEYDDPPTRLQRYGKVSARYRLPRIRNFANMDAIFNLKSNRRTYIFKGGLYWRYNEETGRVDRRFPRSIRRDWKLPSDIDTATTWLNKRIYIFKGDKYYRLKSFKQGRWNKIVVEKGYPKSISREWMKCRQVAARQEIGALESEL